VPEDVAVSLSLSVDEPVVTPFVVAAVVTAGSVMHTFDAQMRAGPQVSSS